MAKGAKLMRKEKTPTEEFTAGADMTSAYKGNLTSVNPVTTRKDWMTIRNRLIGSRKDC